SPEALVPRAPPGDDNQCVEIPGAQKIEKRARHRPRGFSHSQKERPSWIDSYPEIGSRESSGLVAELGGEQTTGGAIDQRSVQDLHRIASQAPGNVRSH